MTDEEFYYYLDNVIPNRLSNNRELSLCRILSEVPELLNHRPLQWFINYYLSDSDILQNEYLHDRQARHPIKRFEDLMFSEHDTVATSDRQCGSRTTQPPCTSTNHADKSGKIAEQIIP